MSSRFLYKWKKSPSFKSLPIFFPKISTDFFSYFFALSHIIPQVKILDYVTIQKQGPLFTTSAHYVVIIYVHLSIKTVKGENDRMVVQRAAVTWCFCVRLAWVTQNEMKTEEKLKILVHCNVVEMGKKKAYLVVLWSGCNCYLKVLDWDSVFLTLNLKEYHDIFCFSHIVRVVVK